MSTLASLTRPALVLLLLAHLSICNGFSVLDTKSAPLEPSVVLGKAQCSGSIGECLTDPSEMESDISRRVLLMQKRYISYETLKRDIVPCTTPGASYYRCDAGQANPYSRGCEVIAGCRTSRDIKN
ncbi:protein RALF-like 24 [Punica granatum]|uniref:Uncharacterized protein n=2 Tax=Punica granatum TaxID=22663 RepID=A0A218XDC9_PUNGR|nr:protein RALF-like 24 [Punica granatum]OWM83215.1 hypothetical protein CDL15_Pgr012696 [Punica granatum]PKI49929.1 hypothetical protein CRG98_029671 [Punica granatum]